METAIPVHHSRRFYIIRIAILFVMVVLAFAAYARFNANQRANLQQVSDNMAVLSIRLQNHEDTIALQEKRIATLEEKIAKTTPDITKPQSSSPTANTGDTQELAKLEKEIAMLKNTSSGMPMDNEKVFQAIRLLSSYHHLADKVMAGKPFASELDAFEEVADKDETIEKQIALIAPFGSNGVPTYAQLLVSFDESLDQLNLFEATPPAGAGLWERFVFNLKHLVNIRHNNEQQTGNSVEAIVSRAGAHLDKNEMEAAIAEIKSLPDAARSNFTSWLEEAQMATQAPGVIDNLEEAVMQKAFQAPAPAEPAK